MFPKALNKLHWHRFRNISKMALRFQSRITSNEFSFNNYDAVGFDFDHTICKYKLKPLYDLIYRTLAKILITNYSYSSRLLKCNLEHEDYNFIQKGILLDKERGNFLKLDANYKIIKGYHGTKELCQESIYSIYGSDHVWEATKGILPALVSDFALEQPFYVFRDYFVTPGVLLCANLVNILDEEADNSLLTYSFWEHYVSSVRNMYNIQNFKLNGEFFKEIKENLELYVEPCSPELKEWLLCLTAHKKTFLCTSANFDYIDFVSQFCLGKNWKDFFDVIVTNAQKPGFFCKSNPFYQVLDNDDLLECSALEVKSHTVYSHGNWKDLKKIMCNLSGLRKPKMLYVGDSLTDDVYAPHHLVGCNTIAVVEELNVEGDFVASESNFLKSSNWGSFFKTSSPRDSCVNLTLWASLLHNHASLVVPNLNVLSKFLVTGEAASFSVNSYGGHFPRMPM